MVQALGVRRKMTSFRVQDSSAKLTSTEGQANSTGIPPDIKVYKAE
jgi:hypothetical protein